MDIIKKIKNALRSFNKWIKSKFRRKGNTQTNDQHKPTDGEEQYNSQEDQKQQRESNAVNKQKSVNQNEFSPNIQSISGQGHSSSSNFFVPLEEPAFQIREPEMSRLDIALDAIYSIDKEAFNATKQLLEDCSNITLKVPFTDSERWARDRELKLLNDEVRNVDETKEPDKKRALEFQINELETITEKDKSGKEVLTELLEQFPISEKGEIKEIYKNSIKEILANIANPQLSNDKKSNLQKIQVSLGDCATPVKSFLIQNALKNIKSNGQLTGKMLTVIKREALEQKLGSVLNMKSQKDQKISMSKLGDINDAVQTMVDCIFLDGIENNPKAQIKIMGERDRLSSKTDIRPGSIEIPQEHAEVLAEICCKTENNGAFVTTEKGHYILDPAKMDAITGKYLAQLGLTNPNVEKCLNEFWSRVEETLSKECNENLYIDGLENPVVVDIMNKSTQEDKLRTFLMQQPPEKIKEEFAKYLKTYLQKIEDFGQSYKQAQGPKEITVENTSINVSTIKETTSLSSEKNNPKAIEMSHLLQEMMHPQNSNYKKVPRPQKPLNSPKKPRNMVNKFPFGNIESSKREKQRKRKLSR